MEAMKVPVPRVVVRYAGKDITADISPTLIELTYADALEGESDTLDLTLEDSAGRWQDAWYPQQGDVLSAQIGYEGAPLLPCGDFEIEEVTLDGAAGQGDTVRIRALAASVTRRLRTRESHGYENTTLADITQTVALREKLTLKGDIDHIRIARVTQVFEANLAFLKRVAAEYGYAFNVRGDDLAFFNRAALKDARPVLAIGRADVVGRYSFRDKVRGVVESATLAFHDPRTKTARRSTARDERGGTNRTSADERKLNIRAEDDEQARVKAEAARDRANEDQTSATLDDMVGNTRLASGVNVQLTGYGKFSGKYSIHQARHSFSRSGGYTTSVELKRVREGEGKKKKS